MTQPTSAARQIKAYGTWPSPVSPRMLAGGRKLLDVAFAGEAGGLIWLESIGAQTTLTLDTPEDGPRDLNEPDMIIRGRVNYGGGEFTAAGDSVIYAGNGGRLYRQLLREGKASAITPAFGAAAAPAVSPDGQWVAYIHSAEGADVLAIVDARGRYFPQKLFDRSDFVMQPVWHPDGRRLAFVTWDFPRMPWDGAQLVLLELDGDGASLLRAADTRVIAGGDDISVFQPEFSPDGKQLAFVSDQAGFWQIYLYAIDTGVTRQLTTDEAEYGTGAWGQGLRMIGWAGVDTLIALRSQNAQTSLQRIDTRSGAMSTVAGLDDYTDLRQLAISTDGTCAALLASADTIPERVLEIDLSAGRARVRRRSETENLSRQQLAQAEPVTWEGASGQPIHGLYYRPVSLRYESPGQPPLIVIIHHGPTSHVRMNYSQDAQFFATRGFAVLFVNHRGSTGYGKAYRDLGRGTWGITDVEDAASGALAMVERGLADPEKRVILGGSAGGYTVLQSLVDRPGFWTAGVSRYGVSNQFTLASNDALKFESRYSEMLLGPLPQAVETYRARSPLFHVENIRDPLILFQGDEDNVVPRAQSDSLVEALRARGMPVEYYVFAGEGHGWRKPETIESYLTLTLGFLERFVIYR